MTPSENKSERDRVREGAARAVDEFLTGHEDALERAMIAVYLTAFRRGQRNHELTPADPMFGKKMKRFMDQDVKMLTESLETFIAEHGVNPIGD